MRGKLIRGLVLILILPLVVIIFSPSSGVSAQCATGSGIEVESGLISASKSENLTSSFKSLTTGSGVSCIGDARAVIPQFALTTYDEMKTLYYDQATCVGCKPPKLSGDQTQSSATSVIDLSVSPIAPPAATETPTPAPASTNPLQINDTINNVIYILNNIISI